MEINDRLKNDIIDSIDYFSEVYSLKNNGQSFFLRGQLACRVEGEEDLDDIFEVCIEIPFDFPKNFPVVKELGERIPRLRDFHIDKEGVCCLGTEVSLYVFVGENGIETFREFLEQVIIIYFFQVKYALKNNSQWLGETEEHGTAGIRDSYLRVFGIKEEELKRIILKPVKKHNKCLCGGGKRFDKCHGKYIPIELLENDFKQMAKFYNNICPKSISKTPVKVLSLEPRNESSKVLIDCRLLGDFKR